MSRKQDTPSRTEKPPWPVFALLKDWKKVGWLRIGFKGRPASQKEASIMAIKKKTTRAHGFGFENTEKHRKTEPAYLVKEQTGGRLGVRLNLGNSSGNRQSEGEDDTFDIAVEKEEYHHRRVGIKPDS